MPIVFFAAHNLIASVLMFFQMDNNQTANNMGGGGMVAMMAACVIFGIALFIALVELVILEYLWIKVWRRRLHAEESRTPAITSRAA